MSYGHYRIIVNRYNKLQKKGELAVLLQGTNLPKMSVAKEPLPPASSPPRKLVASSQDREQHSYHEPANMIGQARQQRQQVEHVVPINRPLAASQQAPGFPLAGVLTPNQQPILVQQAPGFPLAGVMTPNQQPILVQQAPGCQQVSLSQPCVLPFYIKLTC